MELNRVNNVYIFEAGTHANIQKGEALIFNIFGRVEIFLKHKFQIFNIETPTLKIDFPALDNWTHDQYSNAEFPSTFVDMDIFQDS